MRKVATNLRYGRFWFREVWRLVWTEWIGWVSLVMRVDKKWLGSRYAPLLKVLLA